jgi:hypothetical protein
MSFDASGHRAVSNLVPVGPVDRTFARRHGNHTRLEAGEKADVEAVLQRSAELLDEAEKSIRALTKSIGRDPKTK